MTSAIESAPTPRVLLVNLNCYDQPYPVYPLGLAYVAGALHNHGFDTKTWDALFHQESLEECIATYRPEFVGLTLRNIDNVQCHNPKSFVSELLDYCRRIRAATGAIVILGGSGFSVFPEELYALTKVDFGLEGEGEETLPRLLSALRAGSSWEGIDGLHYRGTAGEPRRWPRKPSEGVFTAEPYHEPELIGRYVAAGSLPGVQTQRGCPLNCCYCTYPMIEGKRSRYRSGEQVAAEMKRMMALGVKQAFVVDSVFNTQPDHLRDVCEALIRAKVGMEWECFLRPSRQLTRESFAMMRDAGLRHVEFGSDSFSDPVLRRYGKSFSFEEIATVSRLATAEGVRYSHFLIFGGPGETAETVEETLRRTQEFPEAYYFGSIGLRIYPGTPLWRELEPEKNGATPADYLMEPRFYLAPGFAVKTLHARLADVCRRSPNWVLGDPPPEYLATIERLRKRGLRGPMWEYMELLQRFKGATETK